VSAEPLLPVECPECGNERLLISREDYATGSFCLDCGLEWRDGDEDLHGAMSVPWGFLL
jgi:Zn ribbon nucleic-acid-binding protein